MLNIYTDVSLESLADNMIEKILEAWKNPFEAPVVIFPDSKVAQWFKFRWLEKNTALANLNVKKIDAFILESIIDENEDCKLLTQDILRNLIIAYLEKKIEDSSNEKIFDEIKEYLYDEDGIATPLAEARNDDCKDGIATPLTEARNDDSKKELNYGRLFDFAEMLSGIFLEYEYSRVGDVSNKDGIIDSWLNNENYFEPNSENAKIKEEWQKKIYFDIFSENGCLRQANEKLKSDNEIFSNYITLPQLFWKKSGGAFDGCENSSNFVFIFGFDSIEQFYRKAIKELSSKLNINLYLANPFGDVTKESNNELLKYWGDSGKRNISLWGKNECGEASVRFDDESLEIISAPTKLREVEILHSNICKLLLNKKAQIKDVIVASPNLDAYRSVIYQVFNQSPQKAEDNSSQKVALHLPFSIIDSSENESLTHLALKRLFSLKEKGVLSRPDFFDLVRNPVVQAAKGILPDEVSNWEGWVSSLNIYRDRKFDDNSVEKNWIKSVKSLLLAKLSNVAIDFSEGDTIKPFSDIASSDNESVCRFIDCIDDIEEWLEIGGGAYNILDEVFGKIEKWILMNKVPSGLGNENYIFQKIKNAKDELKWQYAIGSKSISWKIFSKTLLNASSKAKYNTGNLFVNGITFMNFVPNRVIPTKFMFLLGIDEKTFPRKDYKNSLDLRAEKPIDSDELNSEKDKFAFLNQLLNVKEAIYISYVNKDLQKDEDYYPSSVIDDILRYFKKLGKNLEIEKSFNVENRDWKELFTQSALRNKETYEIMMGKENNDNNDNSSQKSGGASKGNYPERVTVYQLRSFLEEPFKARIERILLSEDEEDAEKIEFEPIEFNRLELSKLRKEFVLFCLNNNIESEEDLNEKLNELNDKNIPHFISILNKVSLQLPKEEIFADKVKNDLFKDVLLYSNSIKQTYSSYRFSSEVLSQDIDYIFEEEKSRAWTLSGTANIIANNNDEVHIIDLVTSNDIKPKNYLNAYILSLLYITIYNKNRVCIDLFAKSHFDSININLDSKKAIEYLNNIFKKVFIDNYHKVLPINLFKPEKKDEELDYQTYLNKFEGEYENPWAFFSAEKLFDVKEVCGFSEDFFHSEWEDEMNKQLDLFPEELKVIIRGNKK